MDNELVLTKAGLLDLLSKIDELSDYDIGVTETMSDGLQIQIGSSIYILDTDQSDTVEVDEEVIDEINEINSEVYDNLSSDENINYEEGYEPIESGIIKELAKTLLIGGLVRLSSKLIKDEVRKK